MLPQVCDVRQWTQSACRSFARVWSVPAIACPAVAVRPYDTPWCTCAAARVLSRVVTMRDIVTDLTENKLISTKRIEVHAKSNNYTYKTRMNV